MTKSSSADRRNRLAKLGRDVAVNVVANLVAAFIIYISAIALGYLSAPTRLHTLEVIMLASALVVVGIAWSYVVWRADQSAAQERAEPEPIGKSPMM